MLYTKSRKVCNEKLYGRTAGGKEFEHALCHSFACGPSAGSSQTPMELTAARLRYLMTVSALQNSLPRKTRCVDVAVQLGVARPTASRMLAVLCREGMLLQSPEAGFRLSGEGARLVSRYEKEYLLLTRYLREKLGLSGYDAKEAAMALLTAPPCTRTALCRQAARAL